MAHIGVRPQRKLKILFAEGSSLSARQTLYALAGRHHVDIVDPTRLCLCRFSKYVTRYFRCPSFSKEPEAYVDFLAKRLQAGRYDVLLPPHEQVYIVSRFQDRLEKLAKFAVPDFATIEQTQSKIGFTRVLQELGLPHPQSHILNSYEDLQRDWAYPCYLKLAHGTAGNGVRRVRNAEEMRAAAQAFRQAGALEPGQEFMVQQPAVGRQCTVQAVYQHGRLVGAHCSQTLIVGIGGGNLARESVLHPNVVQHMEMFGARLNWHGALFIEYFYDEATGQPQYYECNPRIGETVNASLAGVELAEALVQISMGDHVDRLPNAKPGIRSHCGFMVVMDKGLRDGNRRDLWAALQQVHHRNGVFEHSTDELTRPREDPWSVLPATWILAQILAVPDISKSIVRSTVNNYSLPEEAADRIRQLQPSRDVSPGRYATTNRTSA